MTRALIVGGGVAGPVAAMALQRAGIEAVVYKAHAPTAQEVGSYLTVATNGIDALRAIGAARPVLDAGFPTSTNVLRSGTGRRPGAVSNGDSRAAKRHRPLWEGGPDRRADPAGPAATAGWGCTR